MSDRAHLPPDDNKGSKIGAFNKSSHSPNKSLMPQELIAEWTVKAQLKLARAGETVTREFSTNDPVNPVHVYYKWSTPSPNATNDSAPYEEDKASIYSQYHVKNISKSNFQKEESFRSTTSSMTCGDVGGGDSAFSGSNYSNRHQHETSRAKVKDSVTGIYGTRCHSTCNITVTAVADFLSPTNDAIISIQQVDSMSELNPNITLPYNLMPENYPEPFVCNVTTKDTLQTKKAASSEGLSASQNFVSMGRREHFRDAVCQTSDIESRYFDAFEQKRTSNLYSPLERHDSRRLYDFRRVVADDRIQQPVYIGRVNEGNCLTPSYIPSSAQAYKSSSVPRVPTFVEKEAEKGVEESSLPTFMTSEKSKHSSSEPQKKPRTVHIDVYCTGSEDGDESDEESVSDSDGDDKNLDQQSNSTFQTVLENEQMRLRHQRKFGHSLPRRLVQQHNLINKDSKSLDFGHVKTKSSVAEEVHESKQLLFRKHLGDQKATKLHNLRQKYLRQPSDDSLSLGYPNSSRSTVRDNTCSSISSVLGIQDTGEFLYKETDEPKELPCLNKSDSFEYENALDRLRIRQMENLWSRNHSNKDESKVETGFKAESENNHLQTISEVTPFHKNSALTSRFSCNDNLTSELEISSEENNFVRSSVPKTLGMSSYNFEQISHNSKNKPTFLQFFGPLVESASLHQTNENISLQQSTSAQVQQNKDSSLLYPDKSKSNLLYWKSEIQDSESIFDKSILSPTNLSRRTTPQSSQSQPHFSSPPYNSSCQRSSSEEPASTTLTKICSVTTPTPIRRFNMYNRSSPSISETSTQLPPAGYSLEYLDKARKFGNVIAARKPGHHIGPTKNPNCSCESCQRWLVDRFKIRSRKFSLGEMPLLKRPL